MSNATHPVFPIIDMNEHPGPMGLTKREMIAAMAMQGILWVYKSWPDDFFGNDVAKLAIAHADALLAELEKEA